MKKIIIPLLSIVFALTACSTAENKLVCSSSTTSNALISNTTYEIKYKDDETKYVKITYDYKNNTNMDGVDADTDGLTQNNNESEEVIDGKIGDAVDDVTDAITETILDLAGLKDTYNNQIKDYDKIEGFNYTILENSDDEYKIEYEIDLDKISDENLSNFNINRNFTNLKDAMENNGYTCN